MKRLVVAGLVRLYPSRWRAEYGEELAGVLMRRPLGAGGVLNVAANAGWQQLQMQEPWLMVGVPATVWVAISLTILLTHPYTLHRGLLSPGIGFAVFCGVGLWTVLARGFGGGLAAIKVAMLVALPYLLIGLLTLVQVVRVVEGPGQSISFRLSGPVTYRTAVFRLFVELPILQILFAGLVGCLGGLVGRVARRLRTA
jgi:hypothetical protein